MPLNRRPSRWICPILMTPKTAAQSRAKRHLPDFLLGISPILLAAQLMGWLTFFPSALHGHADFRQLSPPVTWFELGTPANSLNYRAQQTFQDTLVGNDEPALPFIRPAYQALFFFPFSLLPYRTAYLAFLALNLVLLAIAFWLLGQPWKICPKCGGRCLYWCFWCSTPLHLRSCRVRIRFCCWLFSRPLWFRSPGPESDGWHAGRTGIVQDANRGPDSAAVFAVEALAFLCRIRALRGPGFPAVRGVVGVTQTSAYARSLFPWVRAWRPGPVNSRCRCGSALWRICVV